MFNLFKKKKVVSVKTKVKKEPKVKKKSKKYQLFIDFKNNKIFSSDKMSLKNVKKLYVEKKNELKNKSKFLEFNNGIFLKENIWCIHYKEGK